MGAFLLTDSSLSSSLASLIHSVTPGACGRIANCYWKCTFPERKSFSPSVGQVSSYVIISLKCVKLHFHAPIGALVYVPAYLDESIIWIFCKAKLFSVAKKFSVLRRNFLKWTTLLHWPCIIWVSACQL